MQRDVVFAHALGQCQADVVLVALIHHVAAQPHAVEGHVAQAHGADGQHPVFPVGGIEQQADAQRGGAVHLDIQIIHGGRHGLDEHDDGRADLIRPAVLEPAHEQAQRDADDQAQQHGENTHLHRDGQLFGQDAGHRRIDLINMADAEVAVQCIPPEPPDLHRQRVQQAHGLEARLDLGLGHFFVVCKVAFHGHQPQQVKIERPMRFARYFSISVRTPLSFLAFRLRGRHTADRNRIHQKTTFGK